MALFSRLWECRNMRRTRILLRSCGRCFPSSSSLLFTRCLLSFLPLASDPYKRCDREGTDELKRAGFDKQFRGNNNLGNYLYGK